MKIKYLFDIYSGNSLALIHMTEEEPTINFVSRSRENNGVSSVVDKLDDVEPFEAGLLTVALGGSVLSTFVQEKPFYTAYHVKVLRPKREMSFNEKLFYCMCIQNNAYRYSYGRQANKTLDNLEIPSSVPSWVNTAVINSDKIKSSIEPENLDVDTSSWKWFNLVSYFNMFSGDYVPKNSYNKGETPLVSASDTDNGVMDYCDLPSNFDGNCITIGKVGLTAFYQDNPFLASADVTVLEPKFNLNKYVGLFLIGVLRADSYKWNYGRQIRLGDCKELIVKLPSLNGEPDWSYMESYIKKFKYSDLI